MSYACLDITPYRIMLEAWLPELCFLRWRNERLRTLTAEVASRLGISQNELIEQAIEHEVVAQARCSVTISVPPPIGWPSSPRSNTSESRPGVWRVSSPARVCLSRFNLDLHRVLRHSTALR